MTHDIGLMSWAYTLLTLLAACGWPLFLYETVTLPTLVIVFLVNGIVAANTWYQCSSPQCTFLNGLNAIAESMMSGCANITILYLPFLMAYVYLTAVTYSFVGTMQRRERAQLRFHNLVHWFQQRHLNTPLNIAKYVPALNPSKPMIDGQDPESLLVAASRCEKDGDWVRAIPLYQYVKDHWPEEHGRYADNCIKDIERKRGLANGDNPE